MIAFIADGGGSLGFGHFARCLTIAEQVRNLGDEVAFIVSDGISREALASRKERAVVLGTDRHDLCAARERIIQVINSLNPSCVLFDSYAINESLFASVRASVGANIKMAYLDDQYTLATGPLYELRPWPVDIVINYGFGFREEAYRRAYGSRADLAIGPRFAPVRNSFLGARRERRGSVSRVLVTSGSTNPNRVLEKMIDACRRAIPEAALDVVVGSAAEFDETHLQGGDSAHVGITDLAPLMFGCDLAISAGGSTLYELACCGLPAVAVPIVDNQLENVRGFIDSGCGFGALNAEWSVDDAASLISEIAEDEVVRLRLEQRAMMTVDGHGAKRIASLLCGRRG